jgi:D-alanyl-D-alanine carboxypeptidase/Mannosyl-glycoprotein endo-beta-N-acetylglucosaminidase
MSIENKSFITLIQEVRSSRTSYGAESPEHWAAIRELDFAIREFLNNTSGMSPEQLKKQPKYKDYLAAEETLKNQRVSRKELEDIRKSAKKESKEDTKPKPKRVVRDGQTGTVTPTDQVRTRSTPFGRVIQTVEEGTRTTGVKLGSNTKAKDVAMASLLESFGIDIGEIAKYRKELGTREVIDKKTGEKKLTRKYGVGLFDYASDLARRQGIQGTGPLKQYKTKFTPDPVPLKPGYTLSIDAEGVYQYKNEDGEPVKSSEALTSTPKVKATKESTNYSFTDDKQKRVRIPASAGDVFKATFLEAMGVDLGAIYKGETEQGIADSDRSRLGKLYGRLNATKVIDKPAPTPPAESSELPTPANNKPKKAKQKKSKKSRSTGKAKLVYRVDSGKRITNYSKNMNTYYHNDDFTESGSYWEGATGSFQGVYAHPKLQHVALYATGSSKTTRYVAVYNSEPPVVYFDEKDTQKLKSNKSILSAFDVKNGNWREVPSGEYISEDPGKPVWQKQIKDPIAFIEDQGWQVEFVDDLSAKLGEVQARAKGTNLKFGAEGVQATSPDAEKANESVNTPLKYRRIAPSAGDVFKSTFLESMGINLRAIHEDEVERGIVNKHGEFLDENGKVVSEGKRSRLGALYSRLNKYEKVDGPKAGSSDRSVVDAVNAFKSTNRTLKQVAANRDKQTEDTQRTSEQQQRVPPAPTEQKVMTPADLLLEMLPGITKQITELTKALQEQGSKIGDDVSKAKADEKKGHEEQHKTQPTKPKFTMSSISPKAKMAAKGAAVVGGLSLAGYMATRGRDGQQGPTSIMDIISNIIGSIGQGASNLGGGLANTAEEMYYKLSGNIRGDFVKIMQEAAAAGDPHPEITAAQWALESGYGKHMPAGSNNPFGQMAARGQPSVPAKDGHTGHVDNYVKYNSVADAVADHANRWTKKYTTPGSTPADAIKQIVAHGYNPNPGYASSILQMLSSNNIDPSQPFTNINDAIQKAKDASLAGKVVQLGESAYSFVGSQLTSLVHPDMGVVTTKRGLHANVAKPFINNFQGFINDLEGTGYVIREIGGYANRANVNDPTKPSFHSFGAAIDINEAANKNRGTNTDLPPQTLQIARKWGLGWGLTWKSVKDPMHFSIAKFEGGIAPIDRTTGQLLGQLAPTPSPGQPKPEQRAPEKGWFARDAQNRGGAKIQYVYVPVPMQAKNSPFPLKAPKQQTNSPLGANPGLLLRAHF